jgi:hypothetical protein
MFKRDQISEVLFMFHSTLYTALKNYVSGDSRHSKRSRLHEFFSVKSHHFLGRPITVSLTIIMEIEDSTLMVADELKNVKEKSVSSFNILHV